MTVAAKSPKKPGAPARGKTRTAATRKSAAPPRRVNTRRRKSGEGWSGWRPLLLGLLLLISLSSLAYLVFLHQPETRSPNEPASAAPAENSRQPAASAAPASASDQASDYATGSAPSDANAQLRPGQDPAPPATTTATPFPTSDHQDQAEVSGQGEPQPVASSPPTRAPAGEPDRSPQAAPLRAGLPLLALVIDDMGYRPETERQMLALELELTFSFIPFAPHSEESLAIARRQGRDILLHLPLEALDEKWNPTPGLLRATMNDREIAAGFAAALGEVPMAVGVNNHMGSRFTADAAAMDHLLALLPRYDLFFLDSLTTAASVAAEVAPRHRVPFIRRDVFLDNDQDEEKIRRQLEKLLKIAEQQGWAVGIGHSYPTTLKVLHGQQNALQQRVNLIKLSQLIELHGQ